jgi:predicted permease
VLARWLLRLRPLGSRRTEVEADLAEAFAHRAIRDGRARASLRYFADVLSLWRWNPAGARLFRDAVQDVAYGLRIFRRTPAAVTMTLAGLSLAIGVSTTIFSLLNATVFQPVGVADPDSVFRVERVWKEGVSNGWPYADYVTLRELSRETRLEATTLNDETTQFTETAPTIHDTPQRARTAVVSGGYMSTFGARPAHGRILSEADDAPGAETVAVLGHTFWSRRLDANPSVVGRAVWLNGKPVTIVGVVDRRFTGVTNEPPAVWLSFAGHRAIYGSEPLPRTSRTLVALLARVPDGATIPQAEAPLGALAASAGRESADPYRATGVRLLSAGERRLPKGAGLVVALLLTAIGLIVLLACVNVATLQLASASARQREIGVRLALGASRGRVVRQLITESIALGLAAGAMGLALTIWLLPVVARMIDVPVTFDVRPDARVYAFLFLVSCAAGIGAGLAPARHGVGGDLLTPLKGAEVTASGRPVSAGRLRASLIGVQAAASLVLLLLAALGVRGAVSASRIDLGFDASRMIAVTPALGRFDSPAAKAYLDTALDRVRALPGVEAASLVEPAPFTGGFIGMNFSRDGETIRAFLVHTGADYFSTLGLRIVRGRGYTESEVAAAAPVAVVSETLARSLWRGDDPVGKVIESFKNLQEPAVTVIGVVSDAVPARLHDLRTAGVYRPMKRFAAARILVRSGGQPRAVAPALRAALQPLDARVRADVTLVQDRVQTELDEPRMFAFIAAAVAALALAMAVIGMYGLTAFVTGQRTREIGVRLAVGATRADVLRLLLGQGLRPIVIGLACGAGFALIAGRLFRGAMYGVTARDPISLSIAAVVLLLAGAAAVYLPTRRASRLDPASVLRQS